MWAPLSELFGRQLLYITTYGALTAFNAGTAGAQNVQTLILLRFFAGAFGSSPLTNAGGVIADMFPAKQRGVALSLFAAAPFLGPVLGKLTVEYPVKIFRLADMTPQALLWEGLWARRSDGDG